MGEARNISFSGSEIYITGAHEILAEWTKTPELILDAEEYKVVGVAVDRVIGQKLKLTKEQKERTDLVAILLKIYGSILINLWARKKLERLDRQKIAPTAARPAPSNIAPISSVRPPGFDPMHIHIPKSDTGNDG